MQPQGGEMQRRASTLGSFDLYCLRDLGSIGWAQEMRGGFGMLAGNNVYLAIISGRRRLTLAWLCNWTVFARTTSNPTATAMRMGGSASIVS